MKRALPTPYAAGLVLLLATGPGVRADFIHWSYNWSRSPEEVLADSPGTGRITLTDEGLKEAIGDSDVVATNLRSFSTAPPSNPDHFTNKAYSLNLFLQDQESGQSGTLSFNGVFNGTLSATSSNIKNTFISQTTQSLVLGINVYTATIGPYAPPGPTGTTTAGSISAHAQITVEAIIQTVPEPSALVLCGLGMLPFAVCGFARSRKRANSLLTVPWLIRAGQC
jgi:hypothetical protein